MTVTKSEKKWIHIFYEIFLKEKEAFLLFSQIYQKLFLGKY